MRSIHDLETPAVLIDLDRLEANIAGMMARARASGVALRPHAKTHKIPEIGWMQMRAGAVGLSVAKTSEAEVFAKHGFLDLFVAYPVASPPRRTGWSPCRAGSRCAWGSTASRAPRCSALRRRGPATPCRESQGRLRFPSSRCRPSRCGGGGYEDRRDQGVGAPRSSPTRGRPIIAPIRRRSSRTAATKRRSSPPRRRLAQGRGGHRDLCRWARLRPRALASPIKASPKRGPATTSISTAPRWIFGPAASTNARCRSWPRW